MVVHLAHVQDRDGAKLLLTKAQGRFPRLQSLWADGGYAGKLIAWTWQRCGWLIRLVRRPKGRKGWVLLTRRWVVERTFAWLSNCRALARDYDYHPETSEAWIQVGMLHVMLRRRLAKLKEGRAAGSPVANCIGV